MQVGDKGSLTVLAGHISSSEKLDQKGKELDLQAMASGLAGAGGGEGLWTLAFLFLEREPAPCPPASGTQRLLPFPAWKAPSHPHPGLWGLEEETWSPQGQPSHPKSCPSAALPSPARTLGLPPVWDFYGHVAWNRERRPCGCPLWTCARALCGQTLLGPRESGFWHKVS